MEFVAIIIGSIKYPSLASHNYRSRGLLLEQVQILFPVSPLQPVVLHFKTNKQVYELSELLLLSASPSMCHPQCVPFRCGTFVFRKSMLLKPYIISRTKSISFCFLVIFNELYSYNFVFHTFLHREVLSL